MGKSIAESSGDLLRLYVQAVELFADTLERWFKIPWPLSVAVFFPVVAMVLSIFVWWFRGKTWPLRCEYPTDKREPCRNWTHGEWRRCRIHNSVWSHARRRDRHQVNPHRILRWETLNKRGQVIERDDIYGRGFVFMRSRRIGLLYYKGFARPPSNLIPGIPQGIAQRWRLLRILLRRLREVGLRGLWAPDRSTRSGVSLLLPEVIKATRAVLVLFATGLLFVGAAMLLRGGTKIAVEWAATAAFIAAWMVTRNGIWEAEPTSQAGLNWRRQAFRESVYSIFGVALVAGLSGAIGLWGVALGRATLAVVDDLVAFVFVAIAGLIMIFVLGSRRSRRRLLRRL